MKMNNIDISDLYGIQREIAEIIGIENYIKLSKHFGGEDSLYIQKYSELVKISRNREIRKLRNNGYSASKFAKMYNFDQVGDKIYPYDLQT